MASLFDTVGQAARQDNLAELDRLLRQHRSENLVQDLRPSDLNEGLLPLVQAVRAKSARCAQRLLDESPLLALDREDGRHTPLMIAAQGGVLPLVEVLLPVSEVDAQEPMFGNTALHVACCAGRTEVVERLLTVADPIMVDGQGETPLMKAAQYGPVEMVHLLLKVSDANARNHRGETAMMLVARNGRPDNLRLLMAHSNIAETDHEGYTAFERLTQRFDQWENKRSINKGQWACFELLAAFEPDVVNERAYAGAKGYDARNLTEDLAAALRREIVADVLRHTLEQSDLEPTAPMPVRRRL